MLILLIYMFLKRTRNPKRAAMVHCPGSLLFYNTAGTAAVADPHTGKDPIAAAAL